MEMGEEKMAGRQTKTEIKHKRSGNGRRKKRNKLAKHCEMKER